jgi:hypothetical protein
MPKTKADLPDACPFSEHYDEIDAMIRALGREKGLPHGISPDIVGGDPDYHGYWGNGQEERHRQSVEWRVKLFHELRARPEWVQQWRAAREMDRRVEELCAQKGLTFGPWECPPWWVQADDEIPEPRGEFDCWEATVPLAIRLRRQLEAEIRARG